MVKTSNIAKTFKIARRDAARFAVLVLISAGISTGVMTVSASAHVQTDSSQICSMAKFLR